MKKRGFGTGKWNGFGGKVKENEATDEAARRELTEETGVVAKEIEKMAEITFLFPEVPVELGWDQVVHVYLIVVWEGNPAESEEMKPQWFEVEDLPFGQMWDDDKYWLPLILGGRKIKASFSFDGSNKVARKKIRKVGKL